MRGFIGKSADDGEVFFDSLEWGEDRRKFEGFSAAARSPLVGANSIGHEEAGHADRVGGGSFLSVKRAHCLEKGEGEGGAETAKGLASGKLPAVGLNIGHGVG